MIRMNIGRTLIMAGIVLMLIGILFTIGARFGLGKLPGDVSFKKGNISFYFPISSSIVISLLLTLILNLIFRK